MNGREWKEKYGRMEEGMNTNENRYKYKKKNI